MLNIPRYLFFGIVVGYLYKGLYGSTRAQIEGNGLSGYSLESSRKPGGLNAPDGQRR
jgi:hypothetical protein